MSTRPLQPDSPAPGGSSPSRVPPALEGSPEGPPSGRPPGGRPLERRLLGWLLALTVAPALLVLAVGGWALATSLDVTGALGPWEEVAESGRRVVELADPADPELATALAEHRDALSRSVTQARRWAFLAERFTAALPWLILVGAILLVGLAYTATRQLARQLAQPIEDLVVVAEHLGRGEPLPEPGRRSIREVAILDRSLRDAAAELGAARDRAVSAERLRVWGEMARRVAHEMKNPLTPLRFAAHRLKRACGPDADRGYREAVEVIDEEVARLEELAGQFSSLGRPPEGPPSEIDLAELMRSLLDTDATGVRTEVRAPDVPPVLGHYDALFRAFRNLVRNAVEATEDQEAPAVVVTLESPDAAAGRWLDVRIADNGPGLPPDAADRIFEPDFTTKTRGTGLGLALVRQSVEADGGRVTARTRHEGGAEFVVRLPVAPSPEQEPA